MKSLAAFAHFLPDLGGSITLRKMAVMLGIAPPTSLRQLLEQKIAYEIRLVRLTCLSTESLLSGFWLLEVFADGVLEPPLHGILSNGSSWEISQPYFFSTEAVLELRNKELVGSDNLVGKVTVNSAPRNHSKAVFKNKTARYELQYSVAFRLVPTAYDPTQEEIAAFEQATTVGVWPKIPKPLLIADIKKTVANPFSVQQVNTPLCGPAAIVFQLLSRQSGPTRQRQTKRYVQICRELWESGKFQSRTETIKPSDTLIASSPPINDSNANNQTSVADWMLLATLRDTANAIFPVDANSSQFVMGISTPWEMEDWIFEILGYDTTDYLSTITSGEIEAMRSAQKVWEKGGVAFLMIDDALLKGQSSGVIPTHWVAFQGGLILDDIASTISFICYSWSKNYHVVMKQKDFAEYLFGIVTGR
ncbi:MAG: hypothetical protein JST84_24270 [Acidobacteria bacterium]|nr:hypothetical protein [Acidobacteriota bacterium]